ncbi:hypothetical protein [Niabella soli]|nr:hypothetical protein [Niabella soli]
MKKLKLDQIRYECNAWKRGVNFIMEESVIMKIRLSEILKLSLNEQLVEGVERLQNKLIRNDELIGVFRDDLTDINSFIQTEAAIPAQLEKEFDIKIDRLQHNLLYLEKHFSKLKSEFNNYLRSNMGHTIRN